jgi:hypothetical protein
MNKRIIVASLNEIANQLDEAGLLEESNAITNVMKKVSQYQQMQLPVAPISRPDQAAYGYQAAVDNALQSPMPMQVLAPLLMSVQPAELANAIRVKIGQMKQGLA